MDFKKLGEKKIKKLPWYGAEQIKASTFFFALFLITVWPAFLEFVLRFDWYWYLIISLVIGAPLIKLAFEK